MTYTLEYINDYGESILFSPATGFVLGKTTGLTENTIQTVNSQGINLIGGVNHGQNIKPRIITCRGTILGDAQYGKKKLIATILPGVGAKLVFDGTWQIDVIPTITPNLDAMLNDAAFDFQLEAPYPYWRMSNDTLTSLSGLKPAFKFPWNLTEPWIFAERIQEQLVNVHNAGSVEAGFTTVFRAIADVSNPYVLMADTLEYIKINKNMVAGEIITVQNQANYVSATSRIGDTTVDIFNALDFYNTFFTLKPGDNILRYDADVGRDSLEVRIIHAVTSAGAYKI